MSAERPAVLILAGGQGRRMGGGKPARLLGGRSLLDRAAELAGRLGDPVAIGISNETWLPAAPQCARLPDRPDIGGPLAALAGGLDWGAEAGAVLLQTLPCDAPFLPDDLTTRLVAALMGSGRACAVPESGGIFHWAAGLWRTDLAPALAAHIAQGGRSLRSFAQAQGVAVATWADERPFLNINTEADLACADAIRRALG